MKKEYTFPYKKEFSKLLGEIYRPVVEVHLRSKEGEWFKVFPYADSGADITLSPRSVCKILGLNLKDGKRSSIAGIGGRSLAVYLHKIKMRIGDKEIVVRVGFTQRENVPYLLGRLDILDHFNICFEEDRVRFVER